MGISNILVLCLIYGVTASAYRVVPGQQEPPDSQLLRSPLFGPLSRVAFHLIMISEGLPRAQRQALKDEALTKLLESLETRTNRLKPLLENVFLLLSKKRPTRSDVEMLQTDFEAIQSIFSQLQRRGQEIQDLEDNKSPKKLCDSLLFHVGEGLQAAAGLQPAGFSHSESFPSVITDFITADYLPSAESVYNLNKKLNDFEDGDEHDDSFSDELYSDWNHAHNAIQHSGKKILALIGIVKNSVPRSPSSDEQERLAAASYFMPKGLSDKIQNQNWQALLYRLNEAERMVTLVLHDMRPTRAKPGKAQMLNLAEAIAVVSEIESVLPRLTEVHDDLHHSEGRVRFICNRANRGRKENDEPLEKNDGMRRKLNRLKNDLLTMKKGVRQEVAMLLGICSGQATTSAAIDLMDPLKRFAELQRSAQEQRLSTRFSSEFTQLHGLLSDLHRDASHLRRFIQIGEGYSPPIEEL